MKRIYLSLGSNLGDRAGNLRRAVELLEAQGVRVTRQSSLYETEPMGVRDQGWFLNSVVEAETDLMPRQLLGVLREIERRVGRQRRATGEPREVDMDILLFGSSVVRAPDLEIPHPRMAGRRFVLVPLNEIAPTEVHPILHRTAAELLSDTTDTSEVRPWRG